MDIESPEVMRRFNPEKEPILNNQQKDSSPFKEGDMELQVDDSSRTVKDPKNLTTH